MLMLLIIAGPLLGFIYGVRYENKRMAKRLATAEHRNECLEETLSGRSDMAEAAQEARHHLKARTQHL